MREIRSCRDLVQTRIDCPRYERRVTMRQDDLVENADDGRFIKKSRAFKPPPKRGARPRIVLARPANEKVLACGVSPIHLVTPARLFL